MNFTPTVNFSQQVLDWFAVHGRHDLPWQCQQDVYRVWVSEIMLQQTQVRTVLRYYDAFINRFPQVHILAEASWDDVVPYWAGLGYYTRARNLHRAAQLVSDQGFPKTLDDWLALPGIGRSTAGALMSLGQGQFGVILDGNVKRVLARVFAIDNDLTKSAAVEQLWKQATLLTPKHRSAAYNQAMMDLGATCCRHSNPCCERCPLQTQCCAYAMGQQTAFPVRKARAERPLRHAQVFIIENHQHEWLWLQRPAQGIWGGLWSLPVFEAGELSAPWDDLWQQGISIEQTITHVFTHFSWRMQLTRVLLTDDGQCLRDIAGPRQWMDSSQAQQRGIPSAMRKIIDLFETITI